MLPEEVERRLAAKRLIMGHRWQKVYENAYPERPVTVTNQMTRRDWFMYLTGLGAFIGAAAIVVLVVWLA